MSFLKSGKSVEIDDVKNEIIKHCLQNKKIVEAVEIFSNRIIDHCAYPELWKKGTIKPVHKKNSTGKEIYYRGISLSSCLTKFFDNLILNRLSSCFEKLNIFNSHVMRFRPGMRTVNNVMALKTLIEKQFGKHEKLYCCFVDFSKAFDSVWRNGLLAKMNNNFMEFVVKF